ncbi:hypothetical protein BJV78DRAFT_290194 [Lactifluus subvellereus]|nr:hypothetical protein BJV78DRAFT_290194 [Lactifluus subvellereus]
MGSFVKPPLTIAVHSPTSSCSPPRSPRMASLLSALQDIIGPDSPENIESSLSTGEILSLDVSDASHLPPDTMQGSDGVCSGKIENMQVGHATGLSPPPYGTDKIEKEGDFPDVTSCSTDTDMQGDFASPPGLLDPVEIGSVPPIPFLHAGLGGATARDDSIDSGFAETWVGPTPLSLSPPQLNQPSLTLDLLSSPFGSPLSRVLPKFLPSPNHQHTSPPAPRDSIDIVSPPSFFTTSPQHILPSHTSSLSINSTPATQARQSPLLALPSGQGAAEDADTSNGVFDESDQSMSVLVESPAEGLLFLIPSGEVPVLKGSIPMASYENPIDPHLVVNENPGEDSPGRREEDAPYVVNGTVEGSPVSGQLSWGEISHADDPLPSPTPSEDINATSPLHPTITPPYPISKETTSGDEEFDYEALYQSLIMSPEEVASNRMSSPSPLSPRSLPPRAASTGSHSLLRSTCAPVDIPERPHSTVDILPRSRHQDLGITPVLLSEYTSRTSSPLLETPISSSPSQADASARSVNASPVSLSASGLVAHTSPSTSSSKHARLSMGKSPPQPAPVAGPSRGAFTLNDRSESGSVGSKWNHISMSKKVPFGFRNSSVCQFLCIN